MGFDWPMNFADQTITHSLVLLENECNLKSYDSGPNVSTLMSSVFIRGNLKLLRDSSYTVTNERLFLIMRLK